MTKPTWKNLYVGNTVRVPDGSIGVITMVPSGPFVPFPTVHIDFRDGRKGLYPTGRVKIV